MRREGLGKDGGAEEDRKSRQGRSATFAVASGASGYPRASPLQLRRLARLLQAILFLAQKRVPAGNSTAALSHPEAYNPPRCSPPVPYRCCPGPPSTVRRQQRQGGRRIRRRAASDADEQLPTAPEPLPKPDSFCHARYPVRMIRVSQCAACRVRISAGYSWLRRLGNASPSTRESREPGQGGRAVIPTTVCPLLDYSGQSHLERHASEAAVRHEKPRRSGVGVRR
jgi:hypothetical protein